MKGQYVEPRCTKKLINRVGTKDAAEMLHMSVTRAQQIASKGYRGKTNSRNERLARAILKEMDLKDIQDRCVEAPVESVEDELDALISDSTKHMSLDELMSDSGRLLNRDSFLTDEFLITDDTKTLPAPSEPKEKLFVCNVPAKSSQAFRILAETMGIATSIIPELTNHN